MLTRIASASPARTGESRTERIEAPVRSIRRRIATELWRQRTQVGEGGDRGQRIVPREDRPRLRLPQVLAEKPARPELSPACHLQRDVDVLGEVDPGQVVLEGRQRRHLLPG